MIDDGELDDIRAEMETVKAQLKASQPKRSIISEYLSSIRRILEGVGATLLAAEVSKLLTSLGM